MFEVSLCHGCGNRAAKRQSRALLNDMKYFIFFHYRMLYKIICRFCHGHGFHEPGAEIMIWSMYMKSWMKLACVAAKKGGQVLMDSLGKLTAADISNKSDHDFVTWVDKRSEETIVRFLLAEAPGSGIRAEEKTSETDSKTGYWWIIDPLDGTTNFIHGFPHFCVSVGLEGPGGLVAGAVWDPIREEMFSAAGGTGAFLNDRPVHVSGRSDPAACLVATGFPFRRREQMDRFLARFQASFSKVAGMRRAGSAALDMAYTACGRLDGFWECGLKQWDMAAGTVLVREAGGCVEGIAENEDHMHSGNLLCCTPELLDMLRSAVRIDA